MIVPENTICGTCGLRCADDLPRAFRIRGECICPERWPVPVRDAFPRAMESPGGAPGEVPAGIVPRRRAGRVLAALAGAAGAFLAVPDQARGGPSPEACRPYAAAFIEAVMKDMWMGAYEFCRVEGVGDAVPLLPPDLRGATAILSGELPGSATVGPSGFAPGTEGWKAWCGKVWPESFDGQTVIFEASGRGRRASCPG